MQQIGATDLNGNTWFDRTNYFATVPTGAIETALFMESDRMGYLLGAIDQTKLDAQRGVVQNEKRQGDNQPYGMVDYAQIAGLLPPDHPYGHDTIGSMKDLDGATLADVKGLSSAQSLSSNYGEMAEKAGAKIVPVDGMAQALALVQQGRADFTFNDSLALLDYLKKNPNSGLQVAWTAPADEKIGAGFIVNKGNDEALAKISGAVEELRADGTLKKLGEQFFGVDVSVK